LKHINLLLKEQLSKEELLSLTPELRNSWLEKPERVEALRKEYVSWALARVLLVGFLAYNHGLSELKPVLFAMICYEPILFDIRCKLAEAKYVGWLHKIGAYELDA